MNAIVFRAGKIGEKTAIFLCQAKLAKPVVRGEYAYLSSGKRVLHLLAKW